MASVKLLPRQSFAGVGTDLELSSDEIRQQGATSLLMIYVYLNQYDDIDPT